MPTTRCSPWLQSELPKSKDPREVIAGFRVGAAAWPCCPLPPPPPRTSAPPHAHTPRGLRLPPSRLPQAAVNMSPEEIEAWLGTEESRRAVEQGGEAADRDGRHAARR